MSMQEKMSDQIKIRTEHLTVNIDVPEGWQVVRYGPVRQGQHYLSESGAGLVVVRMAEVDLTRLTLFVVEKAKRYREPVLPADVGKECEFSDVGFDNPLHVVSGSLAGWMRAPFLWQASCGADHKESFKLARIEIKDEANNG